MNELKVLIDRGNAPAHSGIGVYSTGILKAMQLYAPDTVLASESSIGGTSRTFRPIQRLRYLWQLNRLYSNEFGGAHLVHFTNAYVPAPHRRVRFVATVHDLDPLLYPGTHSRRYELYYDRAVTSAIRHAKMILTVTDTMRYQILERYRVPADCVRAISNGVSLDFIAAVNRQPSFPMSEEPIVLFVGALCKKKNTPWIIRQVVSGVCSGALPKMKLMLAGNPGYGFSEVEWELKQSKGIARWISDPQLDELAALYLRSTAVTLPSISEGFGIPLIEAMYCKKPIIASRIATNVEVASETAHYFDLDDRESFYAAVRGALEDSNADERKRRVDERLRRYMWQALVPQYVDAYRQALREDSPEPGSRWDGLNVSTARALDGR